MRTTVTAVRGKKGSGPDGVGWLKHSAVVMQARHHSYILPRRGRLRAIGTQTPTHNRGQMETNGLRRETKGRSEGGMNTAPGPRGRNHHGAPAKPSPVPARAAAPRANGSAKNAATRRTSRQASGRTHSGVGVSTARPAAGPRPARHTGKAPIIAVMNPLTL